MKKSALILYSDTDFGGVERRLIRIHNELGKSNQCDIIVRGTSLNPFKERLLKADCDVSNIHKIITFNDNFKCLLYLIFIQHYDAVQYNDVCGFHQILAQIYRNSSTRTVFTAAFQDYAYGLIDDKVRQNLVKLLNISHKVDVLFPAGKEYFKKICKNTQISVTPGTFTNTELFIPAIKEKIILFAAARLEKEKNAVLLVEACNICQDVVRQYGYTILICGQGFEERYLRNLINQYGINDIVSMPGYVKISKVMPIAEIFLCIDLIDNYPSQTIAEAVSCGCALICTDVGYSRKCGSEKFTTFIPNVPKVLADKIVYHIKMPENNKKNIVKMARKYAEEHYSIRESANYFRRLLWD